MYGSSGVCSGVWCIINKWCEVVVCGIYILRWWLHLTQRIRSERGNKNECFGLHRWLKVLPGMRALLCETIYTPTVLTSHRKVQQSQFYIPLGT